MAVLREIVQRAPDHTLVPISRTPGTGGRTGDFDRPETLAAAFGGLDRLLLIPSADLRPGAIGAQLIAAVDAAIAAGVGHVFLLSSVKATSSVPSHLADAFRQAEERVRRAPRWTILRMGYFQETLVEEALRGGTLLAIAENDVAFVSRDDVAVALAGAIVGDGHAGATYDLSGPRTYSGAERAAAVAAATGTPVTFSAVGADALREMLAVMNLPGFLVDELVAMQARFVAGDYARVTDDVARLAGTPARAIG